MADRDDPFGSVDLTATDIKPQAPTAPRPSAAAIEEVNQETGFTRSPKPQKNATTKKPKPSTRRRRRRQPLSDEPKAQFNQRVYDADIDRYLDVAETHYPTQADAFRAAIELLEKQHSSS